METKKSKDEFPKPLSTPLKTELIGEHHLKHADTHEKVVLPSAQEIETEKKEKSLLKSIESFDSEKQLSKTETHEKVVLPTAEEIAAEKSSKKN